ncbi:MAG TPA: 2-oxoacid:acceptor oxidoreductase family protein, partial [Spirochaetia bacterium]|nr:2-oxoacid:acceptor oxidoreductase family protein [Spirochaetia bacterium]
TLFVYDTGIEGADAHLPTNAGRVLGIPAIEVAKKELHPRVFNIIIMGAVIKATGVVPDAAAKEAIEKKLGYKFAKDPQLRELNFKAIDRGAQLVAGQL